MECRVFKCDTTVCSIVNWDTSAILSGRLMYTLYWKTSFDLLTTLRQTSELIQNCGQSNENVPVCTNHRTSEPNFLLHMLLINKMMIDLNQANQYCHTQKLLDVCSSELLIFSAATSRFLYNFTFFRCSIPTATF